MDVFNHGQWNFQFGNYSIEFGLPSASASQAATTLGQPDPKDIESITRSMPFFFPSTFTSPTSYFILLLFLFPFNT